MENINHNKNFGFQLIQVKALKIFMLSTFLFMIFSCSKDNSSVENSPEIQIDDSDLNPVAAITLPKRTGEPPETTSDVPHVQLNVTRVEEIHEEMVRRIFAIDGIEEQSSVIAGWRGLSIEQNVNIVEEDAIIGGREFGHIHDDGSLHLFLKPERSVEAIDACWAVLHPFAVEKREGWDGFVMLYTPRTIEELNSTFQLIVDGYNYVTGRNEQATNYY